MADTFVPRLLLHRHLCQQIIIRNKLFRIYQQAHTADMGASDSVAETADMGASDSVAETADMGASDSVAAAANDEPSSKQRGEQKEFNNN
jgi:hypothetical protein